MSKRKRSSQSEEKSQSLYQNVISLDKSNEQSVTLLQSVFELLHLNVHELEIKLHKGAPAEVLPDTRPIATWALRWLLKRLGSKDEPVSHLGLDYRSWLLMFYLVRSLPYHVVSLLLRSHDFVDRVCRVLEKLSDDKWPQYLDSSNSDQAGMLKGSFANLDISPREYEQSAKYNEGGQQHQDAEAKSLVPAKCFLYLVQVLDFLQQFPSDADNADVLYSERQAILEADAQKATTILSSGLAVFRYIVQILTKDGQHTDFQIDLCEPLIRLQERAVNSSAHTDSDEHIPPNDCVKEALRLLITLRDAPVLPRFRTKLEAELQDLVAQLWIHPFRESHITKKALLSSQGYHPAKKATALPKFGFDSGTLSAMRREPECFSPAFEIAFLCANRHTASQRTKEDGWMQLFFSLLRGPEINSTRFAGTVLTKELVQTANSRDFRLSSKTISEILHHDEQLAPHLVDNEAVGDHTSTQEDRLESDAQTFDNLDWEVIGLLVTNHPQYFVLNQAATAAICHQASDLFDSTDEKVSKRSREYTYELVVGEVLLKLIHALATQRDLESFIDTWLQSFMRARHALDVTKMAAAGNIELSQSTIWTDERVLSALTERMRSILSPSKRAATLERWTENLGEGSSFQHEALILVNCILASIDSEAAVKAIFKPGLHNLTFESTWRCIVDSTKPSLRKEHPSLKWRAWRILCSLLDAGLVDFSGHDSIDAIASAEYASGYIREQLHVGNDTATNYCSLTEAAFAWVYLIRLIVLIDPQVDEPRDRNVLQEILSTTASLRSGGADGVVSPSQKFHIQITDRFDLALESLATAIDFLASTAWIQELFTQDMVAMIHHNMAREPMESNYSGLSRTWHQLWVRLDQIAASASDSSLKHKITAQHVSTLLRLQEPSKKLRVRFERALDDAASSESFSPTKKDRQSLIHILGQWIESKLLKSDHSRALLSKTQEIHRLLLGGSASPSATLPAVVAETNGEKDEIISLEMRLQRLENPQSSPKSMKAVLRHLESLISQQTDLEKKEQAAQQLKSVFWCALGVLKKCGSMNSFATCAKVVEIILEAKPLALVGQPHVDELFAMIVHTTSVSRKLDARTPNATYTFICHIFGALLSEHRHRINGRYHLIVPALQGLLWCLFKPQKANQQPQWLADSSSPLSEQCAIDFSRLLTSLSDPSPSVARIGAKRSKLNDPTKKAKSIAGQHLSQLIVSFCSFQLCGRLEPQLRTKINPGLYAIMGAMSLDVMQNTQASMGASEKAVFKAFYDDWRKFGRWQGA